MYKSVHGQDKGTASLSTGEAAELTDLFSVPFNCYYSHLSLQLCLSLLSPAEGRSVIWTGEHTQRHEGGFFSDDTTGKISGFATSVIPYGKPL